LAKSFQKNCVIYVLRINPEAIYLNKGFGFSPDFDNASPNLAMLQLQPSDNQQLVISPPKKVSKSGKTFSAARGAEKGFFHV